VSEKSEGAIASVDYTCSAMQTVRTWSFPRAHCRQHWMKVLQGQNSFRGDGGDDKMLLLSNITEAATQHCILVAKFQNCQRRYIRSPDVRRKGMCHGFSMVYLPARHSLTTNIEDCKCWHSFEKGIAWWIGRQLHTLNPNEHGNRQPMRTY
jgi:hypothetical protein